MISDKIRQEAIKKALEVYPINTDASYADQEFETEIRNLYADGYARSSAKIGDFFEVSSVMAL